MRECTLAGVPRVDPSSWSELISFWFLHPCLLAAAVFEFIAFGFLVSHFLLKVFRVLEFR